MAAPDEIRAVLRPKNTIVDDSGRGGPKRYAVRERSYTKYVAGGNPQPHNGKVIGHIIDFQYVPINDSAERTRTEPDMLSYGASALVKSVTKDLKEDLLAVYNPSDAYAMMSLATLKVIKPAITAKRTSTHYHRTFVCRDYPGAVMSRNSIGSLLQRIGTDGSKRKRFYQLRMKAVAADHHVAIDGTLKQDNSKVNDLSAYSHKAKVRGCWEVSVLYAYDIEQMEPICAEVFPGNRIDASSFHAFIRDNDIRKGIIVADQGFPLWKIKEELKERPDLLESDHNPEPKTADVCYEDRWLLELVFNRYKSDEYLDYIDVQNEFSVIGNEFINFISTVATCRIIRKAREVGLFDHMTYGELMDDLSSAWRRTDAPAVPATDDGYWVHTLRSVFDELEALGLSKPVPKPEPKKRGRKPQPKNQTDQTPKRPRGRPRKDAAQPAGNL